MTKTTNKLFIISFNSDTQCMKSFSDCSPMHIFFASSFNLTKCTLRLPLGVKLSIVCYHLTSKISWKLFQLIWNMQQSIKRGIGQCNEFFRNRNVQSSRNQLCTGGSESEPLCVRWVNESPFDTFKRKRLKLYITIILWFVSVDSGGALISLSTGFYLIWDHDGRKYHN